MAQIPQHSLFHWRDVDASSDLDRLRLALSALPDEPLVQHLERRRGHGRDDYPVRPMWNAMLAGVVLQHTSATSLLRELRRNAELRELCGFDPLRGVDAVPTDDAFGRSLCVLMEQPQELQGLFDRVVDELAKELPDLGAKLAGDGKAVPSYGRPVRDAAKQEHPDGRRDTDADWGKKTYRGMRPDGSIWEKVTSWFGYKLHLLVDSTYELPLGFRLTVASTSDSPELVPMVEDLRERHPEVHARAEELAADKGYDSTDNNAKLYDDHGIKPVIAKRTMWKDGEPTRPLFPDRVDSFVYNEQGCVSCIDPETDEQRALCFAGFEADRGALKFRCPAAACGLACSGRAQCEARAAEGVGPFGRVVRVPLALDRRIFTPIARNSYKWQDAYDRRTAVERVNSRVDLLLGFEQHFIRGKKKMQARMTIALVVMLAMALGRIRAGQAELMRSLTRPAARFAG